MRPTLSCAMIDSESGLLSTEVTNVFMLSSAFIMANAVLNLASNE